MGRVDKGGGAGLGGMPSLSPSPPGSRAAEAARAMAQALETIDGEGADPTGGAVGKGAGEKRVRRGGGERRRSASNSAREAQVAVLAEVSAAVQTLQGEVKGLREEQARQGKALEEALGLLRKLAGGAQG